MNITRQQLQNALTEWDRLYREHPEEFESIAVSLLKGDPESYGESSTPFLLWIIKEQKKGTLELDLELWKKL